jgi:DNA-binding NtrC family response regulator
MSASDILVVDDEVSLLILLERILLERTPYSVKTTASPLEALQELETNDYRLVITDLKMPDVDGLDLLQRVKQLDKGTEVVIITAYGSVETAAEAIKSGAYDYITKPFRKEQILLVVERAIQWHRLKGDLAALDSRLFIRPYAEALAAFKNEYARRALARHAGEPQAAARDCCLPVQTLLSYAEGAGRGLAAEKG